LPAKWIRPTGEETVRMLDYLAKFMAKQAKRVFDVASFTEWTQNSSLQVNSSVEILLEVEVLHVHLYGIAVVLYNM